MLLVLGSVICSFICTVLGVVPAPDRWNIPNIASKDGSATLDETLTEGAAYADSSLFTTVWVNNAPTGYAMVYQKYSGMFFVETDSTFGRIYLNDTSSLDYETDPSLVIEVAGGNTGGSGTATLTILVEDTNDNPPEFEYSVYRARITSLDGITQGSYVSTVTATDADSGVNQDLTYAITFEDGTSTSSSSRFSIDPKSGNITTTGYAFEKAIYILQISATDNGTIPLTGTTTMSVCINSIYCGGTSGLFTARSLVYVTVFWLCEVVFKFV